MSESAIRQKIFEIVADQQGLTEVSCSSQAMGMVHLYERWAADWNVFLGYFRDPETGRIFGSEIRRAARRGQKLSAMEEQITHTFIIKSYLAVQDADQTELLFNQKLEELAARFRHNQTLNGSCDDASALSVETIDERMFGGVLCHYAESSISATEYL
jgi:hypothetical protein